jgi:polygalacturonase
MPQITRPPIPKLCLNLRDFGALEGGTASNTEAFQKAIEACSGKGGGHVIVPKGRWLTGPIHLKSNIDLHLEEGAEVIFSDRPEDYLPPVFVRSGGIELYNYSPLIYARDCQNVAVTGPGTLNGNGAHWWNWKKKESKKPAEMARNGAPSEERRFGTRESAIRPSFVSFIGCKNVLMEGFTITSGPMWTLHPVYCENILIRRVHVDTHGPNNDGMDPDSCKNVLVEHCTFTTGDDCLVLKSGYNEDGRRVNRPTENVVMRHCSAREGHGGLVIGSEMSGGVRNVFMHDCDFDGTDHAVRIKSRIDRGGFVENVWIENVTARNLKRDVVILTMAYGSDHNGVESKHPPVFRNFHLKKITSEGAPTAIVVQGTEESPIHDVVFEDLTITSRKGVVASHAKGFTFQNVQLQAGRGPVYLLDNVSDFTIAAAKAPRGLKSFLKLEGPASDKIRLESCDLSGVKQPIVFGQGVSEQAVQVK